ncbi:MAG: hypothetical protein DWQ51_01125, partial [Microcystis wesenbergii TW10]
ALSSLTCYPLHKMCQALRKKADKPQPARELEFHGQATKPLKSCYARIVAEKAKLRFSLWMGFN